MALSIQDSRILLKRSTTASEVPTAAPSTDFTDGTWTSLDIYAGEAFANMADEKLWLRFTNNIRQIAVADSPTVNRLTYWNASGHLGNVAAPTTDTYLKYTNASGYHWATAGGAESQDWNDVLTLGRITDGVNPFISAGDAIEWHNTTASFTTTLTNDQATAANRTIYLPKFSGQLAYSTADLTSGRVTYATTNGALTDTSLFTFDGTKLGVGIATATATVHSKGATADSTAYAFKADNSSSSALLYVKNDGFVGIGATSPLIADSKLRYQVALNATNFFEIANSSNGTSARTGIIFINDAATAYSSINRYGSGFSGTYTGTSINKADTTYINAGGSGDDNHPFIIGANPLVLLSNGGISANLKGANGMLITAASNVHNSASAVLEIVGGSTGTNFAFKAGDNANVRFSVRQDGRINMSALPTSSAGLSTGDLWNDAGTIKIA